MNNASYLLFGKNGGTMVPIEKTGLKLGQVVSYGDMANPRHKAVVTAASPGFHGQQCIFLDDLHFSEVSKTHIEGLGGWEYEDDPPYTAEQCAKLVKEAENMRALKAENQRLKAEIAAKENEAARKRGASLTPAGAKWVIVAEQVMDTSDIQTDYFNTTTKDTILLGFSNKARDDFKEMRKAAATFEPTKNLGLGCDAYTARVVLTSDITGNSAHYYIGSTSHWHSELDGGPRYGKKFSTRAGAEAFVANAPKPENISFDGVLATFEWRIDCESVEHREKYSMGHGFYLKKGSRYSDGWEVRKVKMSPEAIATMIGKGKYRPGLFSKKGSD